MIFFFFFFFCNFLTTVIHRFKSALVEMVERPDSPGNYKIVEGQMLIKVSYISENFWLVLITLCVQILG